MKFEAISEKINEYKDNGKKLFTSSSFQSHSLVLLHILSRIDRSIPIYFIDTGYHFPETVRFRDQIVDQFGLNLVNLRSSTPRNLQKDANGKLLYASDPDFCCYLNKVAPLDQVLMEHDIWINGVRGDQSATRKAMLVEQPAPHNTIRFHPMLDWTSKMIYNYRKEYNLPDHPLVNDGYLSIGCEPCTRKFDLDMQEREARWYGMNKTECGLHTELVTK